MASLRFQRPCSVLTQSPCRASELFVCCIWLKVKRKTLTNVTSSSWLWSHRCRRWTDRCCSNPQSGTIRKNRLVQNWTCINVTHPGSDLNWSLTGRTHYPGEEARGFVFGHQLSLVRTEDCPLGDGCIHAANIHFAPLGVDLQAWWNCECRPVSLPRRCGCVGDKQRGPVGRTLLLEIVLTLLTDWKTSVRSL